MDNKTFSHYTISAELGRGGMGVVYRAHDTRLNRDVALKFLADHLIPDEASHGRFMQEARAAAALSHANICTLYDIGDEDGKLYLVMEFVAGESLKEVITNGTIPVEETQRIVAEIATGLERAHETGIVHRDIKPANIMVSPRGEIKIMDFGLAKLAGGVDLTKTGSTIGTALYMSPEQARGESLDAASDVWSLGVVFYEMLTGERPFKGEYDAALIYGIMNVEPEIPDSVSPDLAEILSRMLDKEASKRPTASEVVASLGGRSSVSGVVRPSSGVVTPKSGAASTVSVAVETPSKIAEIGRKASTTTVSVRTILTVLAVIIAVALVWIFRPSNGPGADSETLSIAVIPFGDLNPDQSYDYLGEGIAESIVSMLTEMEGIRTPPIRSTRRFRGSTEPVSQIGNDLDSRYLLQGSVQSIGERVRLTVYLLDSQSEDELWRDQIDASMADLFELQDSVSVTVSLVLSDQFAVGGAGPSDAESGTSDVEAYDFYLRGQFAYQNRQPNVAVAMFDSSLARDPNYAEAMVRKSYALSTMVGIGRVRLRDVFDEGIRLADRANELKPDNPKSLMALASLYGFNLEFGKALEYGARSYAQDSLDTQSILRYTVVLRAAGHIETTLRLLRRAKTLDPLDTSLIFSHAGIASHLGYLDEARASVENALLVQPNNQELQAKLAEIYALSGDYDQALEVIEPVAESSSDPLFIYYLATFHGRSGNLAVVRGLADRFDAASASQYIPYSIRSELASYLGEIDKAKEFFQQAVIEREPWTSMIGMGFSRVDLLNTEFYEARAMLLRPNNPWRLAAFDDNGVVLNANEIQAAAEALDGVQ